MILPAGEPDWRSGRLYRLAGIAPCRWLTDTAWPGRQYAIRCSLFARMLAFLVSCCDRCCRLNSSQRLLAVSC